METSRAEMGSSQMRSVGSTTSARAIEIRWRWPRRTRGDTGPSGGIDPDEAEGLRGEVPSLAPGPARAEGKDPFLHDRPTVIRGSSEP